MTLDIMTWSVIFLVFLSLILIYKNYKKNVYIEELESSLESKIKFAYLKVGELEEKLNKKLEQLMKKRKDFNKKVREHSKPKKVKSKVMIVKSKEKDKVHNIKGDFDFLDEKIASFEEGLKKLKGD